MHLEIQINDIPVARISIDGEKTFGLVLRLAANGTLNSTEEEEAVGGTPVT
jgi:hypothetical protein